MADPIAILMKEIHVDNRITRRCVDALRDDHEGYVNDVYIQLLVAGRDGVHNEVPGAIDAFRYLVQQPLLYVEFGYHERNGGVCHHILPPWAQQIWDNECHPMYKQGNARLMRIAGHIIRPKQRVADGKADSC